MSRTCLAFNAWMSMYLWVKSVLRYPNGEDFWVFMNPSTNRAGREAWWHNGKEQNLHTGAVTGKSWSVSCWSKFCTFGTNKYNMALANPRKMEWCNCCDTVLLGIRALPIQDLKIAWDVTVCTNVADWYSQIRHWTSCRQRCLKYANLIAPYKFQPVAVQLTWADVRCYSLLPVRLRPQNFRTFRQSIWCTVLISTNQYVDPSFLLSLVPRDRQITIQVCFYISFLAPRIFSTGKKEQNIIIIIILIKLLLLSFLF